LAANIIAYRQKLHTRRDGVGEVAKGTKALYCAVCHNVNGEATWIERIWPYPARDLAMSRRRYARMPERQGGAVMQNDTVRSQQMP
jgi:hypothetical protein